MIYWTKVVENENKIIMVTSISDQCRFLIYHVCLWDQYVLYISTSGTINYRQAR